MDTSGGDVMINVASTVTQSIQLHVGVADAPNLPMNTAICHVGTNHGVDE